MYLFVIVIVTIMSVCQAKHYLLDNTAKSLLYTHICLTVTSYDKFDDGSVQSGAMVLVH